MNASPSRSLSYHRLGIYTLVLAAVLMTSCSTVNVRTEKGALSRESIKSAKILQDLSRESDPSLALISDRCVKLLRDAKHQELLGRRKLAEGAYLKAAVEARAMLLAGHAAAGSTGETQLIELHNHALAKFGEIWSTDPARAVPGPYQFSFQGNTYEIRQSPGSAYNSKYFDRAVATESIKGKGVVDKHRDGFGASLVGIRKQTPERAAELSHFLEHGIHLPITLTIDQVEAEGDTQVVSISLRNPVQQTTVAVGERHYPLAADFSAPMEILLQGKNEFLWGLEGFFDAKGRIENSGLFLLEPYDPNRIPVILTHGLISVPIIWRDIVPEFLSEPDIARRYQFMLFTYPSSYPIVESAQLFRNELARMRQTYDPEGNDPLSNDIVAMGHSMGGVLTHLLVSDLDDRLWNEVSDVPIEELHISDAAREEIRSLIYFEPDPAVKRAVFLSAPHGGADLANLSAAEYISRLVMFPANLVATTTDFLDPTSGKQADGLKVDISKRVTSVQSLRPDSPVSVALTSSPFNNGVKYHSIIGDRGKGDTPNSSDGVVDYWSSHVDGAESELIVPTGHTTYTHPNAIADLKRILRLHVSVAEQ